MIILRHKIFFVATIDSSVNSFLLHHIKILSKYFDVLVITTCDDISFIKKQGLNVKVIPMKISRKIQIFNDLLNLIRLISLLIKYKPKAVHSITPKAGLLAMVAAGLVHVPVRVHTFTGQIWVNKRGFKRFILKFFDYLISNLSTLNIVDSPSQRDFLIKQKVLSITKATVFGLGSVSGVDLKRFKPDKATFNNMRAQLSIPKNAFVFTYLGRLNKDKGILDLAYAFSMIETKKAFLLVVGPDEHNFVNKIKKINKHKSSQVRIIGHTSRPEDYLAASDALCLPSYREGFGSVIIEAAATGVPAIASNIYGISDAIINLKTGILHQPKDVKGIISAMQNFLNNPELVKRYGRAAKKRVIVEFDANVMSKYWLNFYFQILGSQLDQSKKSFHG